MSTAGLEAGILLALSTQDGWRPHGDGPVWLNNAETAVHGLTHRYDADLHLDVLRWCLPRIHAWVESSREMAPDVRADLLTRMRALLEEFADFTQLPVDSQFKQTILRLRGLT